MQEVQRAGVMLDICPNCGGVWLDRGELEKIQAGAKERRADMDDQFRRFEQDVDQLFTIATQRLGTVTGLVNNAGLTAHIGDLIDTPVEVIRRVIEVNLVGEHRSVQRPISPVDARSESI